MFSDSKYVKPLEKQEKSKLGLTPETEGVICAILSGILFGTMPLMAKSAYALGSNAYTVAFGRFFTGALVSGLVLLMRYGTIFKIAAKQLAKVAVLSIFFSAMPCMLYGSYRYIDSGLATTLHFTYPIIVMLISVFVFRAKFSRTGMICLFMCVAGILCLCNSEGNMDSRGIFLAAGSGVVYAVYISGIDRSGLKELPVMVIIFWLSLFSAAEILLFSFPQHQLLFALPWQVWISYTGLGLVAMVIAASLFQIGIMKCGGVKSSMLSTVEPVTGVLIGALIFQEKITVKSAKGIILILLSVLFLTLSDNKNLLKKK